MAVHTIPIFDTWQRGYAGSTLTVFIAGTTTKASLFTDQALTVAAANPQTLDSKTIESVTFGKLLVPLYTSSSIKLDIDGTEVTGIYAPPITTLAAEDASGALVTVSGGSVATRFDILLKRFIHAEDYGVFLPTSDGDASASTNNATLTTALGIASGNSGGGVIVPGDTYTITQATLPAGVRLVGQARGASIIQSQTAGRILTITGQDSGLEEITIDGVTLVAGSTGIYAKAINQIHMRDVLVKRYETGLHMQGGREMEWQDLYISNCVTGAKLHGDNDAGGGADGDEWRHNQWIGGIVDLCTTIGVQLSFTDKKCWHNSFQDVGFEANTGVGIDLDGARHTNMNDCWWTGNTINMNAADSNDTANAAINTFIGLHVKGGSMNGGALKLFDTCQDVIFDAMELSDVDVTLTVPLNNVVVRDCIEDSLVTLSGDGTKWTRMRTMLGNAPTSSGQTTNATATKAWSVALAPGERGVIEAVIVGNQRDGIGHGHYHISRHVHRPGSTLAYDAQTVNYTVGATLTGGNSGATALIIADSDSGATGTLTLREISGTFENNETITDSSGGSATANGTVTNIDVVLLGSTVILTAASETDAAWAADFVLNAGEVEIKVTGEASKTIDWVVSAEAVIG